MPTLPKGHPDRPLYSAARVMILLGALSLLGAIDIGYGTLWGLALAGPTREVLTSLAVALFTFGGGVALFFMAEGMRRHRRWALYGGIVVTMLFMLLLELGFFLLDMADWDWKVRALGLLALLLFGLLLVQLFRSRRAIRLHEMGAIGRGFEVMPDLPHPHAGAVQALPVVAEDEPRERGWPIVACTALVLIVPCAGICWTVWEAVSDAHRRAIAANVEREVAAALEQHLRALDPESEITQRYGGFTGLRDVTFHPFAGPPPLLGATAQFDNAEAPVTLQVRNGPAVKIEYINLGPDMSYIQRMDWGKGWRVELRGAEFWAVPPGPWRQPDPYNFDSTRDPQRLVISGEVMHPAIQPGPADLRLVAPDRGQGAARP